MSRRTLALLAVGALALRVAYALFGLGGGDYRPISDAHHYHGIASALADGRGFSHTYPFNFEHATAWRPPLYPSLLAAVYEVFGVSVRAGQMLSAVLGTVTVVLAALMGTRLAGPTAGLAAGVLLAVYPPLLAADVTLLTESLSLLLLLAIALLADRGQWRSAGLCAGLLTLTRPSAQALVAAIGLWVVWRLGWRKAAWFVGCAVIVVVPWILRNWVQLGRPLLVTSNGFNMAALYSPEAMRQDRWVDPALDPRFGPLRFGVPGEAELDERFRDYAWESLRRNPAYPLRVVSRHLPLFFELDPGANRNAEHLDGRSFRLRTVGLPFFYLVTAVGMVGMWRLWRRRGGQPLVIAALYFAAASLPFVTVPRLRAPFDLVCVIGAAVALADLLEHRRRRHRSPVAEPAPEEDAGVAVEGARP